jgi:hypothetical protein
MFAGDFSISAANVLRQSESLSSSLVFPTGMAELPRCSRDSTTYFTVSFPTSIAG